MYPSNEAMIDFWIITDKAIFDQLLNIPGVLKALLYVPIPPGELANELLLRFWVCSPITQQLVRWHS